MIVMYSIINDEIVNRRYYKNNTEQTREHYISTLRKHFTGNYKMLDNISYYRKDFVQRSVIPFDDDFSFVIENQYFDGEMFTNTFYSYNFDVSAAINLTLLFAHDDYETRKVFREEVLFYLNSYNYINVKNKYIDKINEFVQFDNEIIYVEKHNLSMRKEDD